ncbi:MAG TPA: hypothetical protein VFN92_02595 [Solirubrobacterales bacterium]|nr:hypothetical protein [Solirubrobacterales bacterium]
MSTEPQKPEPREVLTAEELWGQVEDLLEIAVQRGLEAASQRTRPVRHTQRVLTTNPQVTEGVDDFIREEMRQLLEADILPVGDNDDEGMFEEEVHREIIKKALVSLKSETLRNLAQELGVDKRGKVEHVAERIARVYRFDQHSIADLIVEHADEPEPARRFLDRLFPIATLPSLQSLCEELRWAMGRYVRVGLARWFAIQAVELSDSTLRIEGMIRSYKAFVTQEDDKPTLGSSVSEVPVAVAIHQDHRFVHVERADASAARSCLRALNAISKLGYQDSLPLPSPSFPDDLGIFDPHTVLILDAIYNRLPHADAHKPNLTVAKFRMQPGEDDAQELEEEERPSLRAVRFEGRHLLDSVPACQLIALEGRALVDLSLVVGVDSGQDGEEVRLPIRLSIERDHLAVMTGYGLRPKLAENFHETFIRLLERAVIDGVLDRHRLGSLARRIHSFAVAEEPADRPRMLEQ